MKNNKPICPVCGKAMDETEHGRQYCKDCALLLASKSIEKYFVEINPKKYGYEGRRKWGSRRYNTIAVTETEYMKKGVNNDND